MRRSLGMRMHVDPLCARPQSNLWYFRVPGSLITHIGYRYHINFTTILIGVVVYHKYGTSVMNIVNFAKKTREVLSRIVERFIRISYFMINFKRLCFPKS